jgi:hypothetical protein
LGRPAGRRESLQPAAGICCATVKDRRRSGSRRRPIAYERPGDLRATMNDSRYAWQFNCSVKTHLSRNSHRRRCGLRHGRDGQCGTRRRARGIPPGVEPTRGLSRPASQPAARSADRGPAGVGPGPHRLPARRNP